MAGVAAECVVHPEQRRHGWGGRLVGRAVEVAAPYPVLLWSHGDHPGAARLARRLGFERVRDLWQMRRDLTAALPAVELPAGVRLRTFVVGADEQAWLELNSRAFADHPEQGGMGMVDLTRRIGSEWFDADGFFLAERDGRLVGFHWTKVHPGDGDQPPVGEVYVVGVDPDAQGGGLGRALTLAGLHHLRDRGLSEVLLYVEADNLPARRVYERLGFDHVATDTRYRHPGLQPSPRDQRLTVARSAAHGGAISGSRWRDQRLPVARSAAHGCAISVGQPSAPRRAALIRATAAGQLVPVPVKLV